MFSFFLFSVPISSVIFRIKVYVKSWWMIQSSPCCCTVVLRFLGFVPSKFKYCLRLFFWTISFSNLIIQLAFFFLVKKIRVCVCMCSHCCAQQWSMGWGWTLSEVALRPQKQQLHSSFPLVFKTGLEKYKIKDRYRCFPQVPECFLESVWGFWLVSGEGPRHILKEWVLMWSVEMYLVLEGAAGCYTLLCRCVCLDNNKITKIKFPDLERILHWPNFTFI